MCCGMNQSQHQARRNAIKWIEQTTIKCGYFGVKTLMSPCVILKQEEGKKKESERNNIWL